MTGSSIGSGDGQAHLVGERAVGSGFGSKPSLPQHLRNFDPLAGPARAGAIPPGSSTPLTQDEANFLNKHYSLHPTGPLPPNEDDLGPFLANIDERRNRAFNGWMRTDAGRVHMQRALMQADLGEHSQLGIGLHDIAKAFGSPGASNWDLISTLTYWAHTTPGVRDVLDAEVNKLLVDGRIPRNVTKDAS